MTTTFRDLGVPEGMAVHLDQQGLAAPFPIQEATLRDAFAGRDVAGKAPTGSGKTIAFSLPVATAVRAAKPKRPTALILVPTRELATQVAQTLTPLAKTRGRSVETIFGGTSINRDVTRLRRGVDAIVACPGRLEDLVRRGDVQLGDVDLVVLDEADRMADMGFLPVVTRLLDATSKDRQTLLFSATLDGDVDQLVRKYQRDPARHEVATAEEDLGDVRHLFWAAERPERRKLAAQVLRTMTPAIVFTRTKRGADRLAKQLGQDGIRTAAIHGDRSQGQRERALKQFHDGSITTLVATDVAARGIHVDDVALVMHYDLPADPKDYVHRSGRTGRAGSDGVVVAFVADEQRTDLSKMQRNLQLPDGLHDRDLGLLTVEGMPSPTMRLAPESSGGNRPAGGGGGRSSNGRNRRRRGGGGGGQAQRSGGQGQQRSGDGQRSGDQGKGQGQRTGGGQPRGGARSSARRRAS